RHLHCAEHGDSRLVLGKPERPARDDQTCVLRFLRLDSGNTARGKATRTGCPGSEVALTLSRGCVRKSKYRIVVWKNYPHRNAGAVRRDRCADNLRYSMDIKPIKTRRDYKAALKQIESLMAAKRGTPEGD